MPAGPVGQSGLQMSRIFPNTGTLQNRVLRSFTRLHLMIWCFHTVRLLLLKLSKTNFQPNLKQISTNSQPHNTYIYIYIYRKSIYINSNHPRSSSSHGNFIHESQMPKLVNWDGLTMHEPITSFPRQKLEKAPPKGFVGLLVWSWQGSLKEITLAGCSYMKEKLWHVIIIMSAPWPNDGRSRSLSHGSDLLLRRSKVIARGAGGSVSSTWSGRECVLSLEEILDLKIGEGSVKCKIIRLQPSWNTWNTWHARRHENWEAGFLDICSRKAEKTFHQFDVCNISWERPSTMIGKHWWFTASATN